MSWLTMYKNYMSVLFTVCVCRREGAKGIPLMDHKSLLPYNVVETFLGGDESAAFYSLPIPVFCWPMDLAF